MAVGQVPPGTNPVVLAQGQNNQAQGSGTNSTQALNVGVKDATFQQASAESNAVTGRFSSIKEALSSAKSKALHLVGGCGENCGHDHSGSKGHKHIHIKEAVHKLFHKNCNCHPGRNDIKPPDSTHQDGKNPSESPTNAEVHHDCDCGNCGKNAHKGAEKHHHHGDHHDHHHHHGDSKISKVLHKLFHKNCDCGGHHHGAKGKHGKAHGEVHGGTCTCGHCGSSYAKQHHNHDNVHEDHAHQHETSSGSRSEGALLGKGCGPSLTDRPSQEGARQSSPFQGGLGKGSNNAPTIGEPQSIDMTFLGPTLAKDLSNAVKDSVSVSFGQATSTTLSNPTVTIENSGISIQMFSPNSLSQSVVLTPGIISTDSVTGQVKTVPLKEVAAMVKSTVQTFLNSGDTAPLTKAFEQALTTPAFTSTSTTASAPGTTASNGTPAQQVAVASVVINAALSDPAKDGPVILDTVITVANTQAQNGKPEVATAVATVIVQAATKGETLPLQRVISQALSTPQEAPSPSIQTSSTPVTTTTQSSQPVFAQVVSTSVQAAPKGDPAPISTLISVAKEMGAAPVATVVNQVLTGAEHLPEQQQVTVLSSIIQSAATPELSKSPDSTVQQLSTAVAQVINSLPSEAKSQVTTALLTLSTSPQIQVTQQVQSGSTATTPTVIQSFLQQVATLPPKVAAPVLETLVPSQAKMEPQQAAVVMSIVSQATPEAVPQLSEAITQLSANLEPKVFSTVLQKGAALPSQSQSSFITQVQSLSEAVGTKAIAQVIATLTSHTPEASAKIIGQLSTFTAAVGPQIAGSTIPLLTQIPAPVLPVVANNLAQLSKSVAPIQLQPFLNFLTTLKSDQATTLLTIINSVKPEITLKIISQNPTLQSNLSLSNLVSFLQIFKSAPPEVLERGLQLLALLSKSVDSKTLNAFVQQMGRFSPDIVVTMLGEITQLLGHLDAKTMQSLLAVLTNLFKSNDAVMVLRFNALLLALMENGEIDDAMLQRILTLIQKKGSDLDLALLASNDPKKLAQFLMGLEEELPMIDVKVLSNSLAKSDPFAETMAATIGAMDDLQKKRMAGANTSQLRNKIVRRDWLSKILIGMTGLYLSEMDEDTSGGMEDWMEHLKQTRQSEKDALPVS